jgi:hypothetical protein
VFEYSRNKALAALNALMNFCRRHGMHVSSYVAVLLRNCQIWPLIKVVRDSTWGPFGDTFVQMFEGLGC